MIDGKKLIHYPIKLIDGKELIHYQTNLIDVKELFKNSLQKKISKVA